jgi:predicted Zn-dependent peptidase
MHRKPTLAAGLLAVLLAAGPATAIDVAYFEERVTTTTLDNGLTLVIYERPTAPVVSFLTFVDVGAAQEVAGITGLAHMFEHMAFKGTSKIGTTDFKAEKKALAREDEAYAAYAAARARRPKVDPDELEALKQAFEQARDEAAEYVVREAFTKIVDRAGGAGVNAGTGADITFFQMSLPANKVELWAYLESERFLDPVFREFYQERDVVQEERRMRVESQPVARLVEQLQGVAFQAHPYGHNITGHMSDLESFTRQDAHEFYATYHGPSNITAAIVGDVKADEILPMLKRYFGRLKPRPEPPPLRTVEPEQTVEKEIVMTDPSQPFYLEGYHRPSAYHPDDAVYDAISDVLSAGRTSRLHLRLVRDEKIAAFAGAFSGYPGSKYPHLMLFLAATTPGHTNEEIQAAIHDEIERLKHEPVSDEELSMVKTRAKANLIRGLENSGGIGGIAGQLAMYQARYRDWRELFRSVERIEKVTKEDIMRVAQATFVPTNRTVAMIVNEDTGSE